MAKSFKELGRKAEELIEQGKATDQRIQTYQASVAAAARQVYAARNQLARASETDEDGTPMGDVEQARIELSIANNQLAASQRALTAAENDAARIREEKNTHVREIETHNRVARENLEKLRKLNANPFSSDAIMLTKGMVERFNEAEKTRVTLLKSMGIEATADSIPIDGMISTDLGWRTGGFRSLDLSGTAMSISGNGGSFNAPGLIGTEHPFDSSNTGTSNPTFAQGTNVPGSSAPDMTFMPDGQNNMSIDEIYAFIVASLNGNGSVEEIIASLKAAREQLLHGTALRFAKMEAEGISQAVKVKKLVLSDHVRYEMEKRYIEDMIEVYRENLRDRGISDGAAMETALAFQKKYLLELLDKDISEGTYHLNNHPIPDFGELADQVRALYAQYPPQYELNDYDRERIREGIRNGTVGEEKIKEYGKKLRKDYDDLVKARNAEWDQIKEAWSSLKEEFRNAKSSEEREKIELRRKILTDRENVYHRMYNYTAIMCKVLQRYRPIGPKANTPPQSYINGSITGCGKVIEALETVRNAIPTDWVERGNTRPIIAKKVHRGYFVRDKGMDVIALNWNENRMGSCAFHEMGHRMERLYPEILEIERQFYERRTKNSELKQLGVGYSKDEVTRVDHFVSSYMGKDYGGSGYELLSMGMEAVYKGTINLSKDNDFQDLIFGILAII